MLTPPRSRPPLFIYHPMTRQQFRPRRIPKRPSHHPGMTRPPRQGRDITICRHLPARNLANNVQHLRLKHPSLLHRHSIQIILHLSKECQKGRFCLVPFLQNGTKQNRPQWYRFDTKGDCPQLYHLYRFSITLQSKIPQRASRWAARRF